MVRVSKPPPRGSLRPIYSTLPPDTPLMRLYNPNRYSATPTTFRVVGPRMRFDHHRIEPPATVVDVKKRLYHDPDRGISYMAHTLSCCLAEVFGDARAIRLEPWMFAILRPQRPLELLDLCGHGAMGAGTIAAISKVATRSLTQSWSRWFYDHVDDFRTIDGLAFLGAHDDQPCVALFERCQTTISHDRREEWPLAHPALRPIIDLTAHDRNMIVL
jgi:hypothetical protein